MILFVDVCRCSPEVVELSEAAGRSVWSRETFRIELQAEAGDRGRREKERWI